jgi:endonuclease/exonuclease/phosphatase (EEP) superfamily protein YafD
MPHRRMNVSPKAAGYSTHLRRIGRLTSTVLGWCLGATLGAFAVVRVIRPERTTADIAVTAAAPWLLAPSWPLLCWAVSTRRRRLTMLAAALATYNAVCALEPYPGRTRNAPSDSELLRVAFANVWWLNRDVRGILAELAAGRHDVVALAEVTQQHVGVIDEVLPSSEYPWRWCEPGGSQGLALLSRVPLGPVEKWLSQGHPQLDAKLFPERRLPIRLVIVHTWGPVGRPAIRMWRSQLAEIAGRLQGEPPRLPGPLETEEVTTPSPGQSGTIHTLVMGDFNATRQHRGFDALLANRNDARERSFGGWRATWPANRWHPPLFNIDHILAGGGVRIVSGEAGRASGSDHRPVCAVVALPSATERGWGRRKTANGGI